MVKRASLTVAAGSVGAGARVTFTVSVPGVNPGDPVLVECLDQFPDALRVWGRVDAPGLVTVVVFNPTAGSVNYVTGTDLYVAVIEP